MTTHLLTPLLDAIARLDPSGATEYRGASDQHLRQQAVDIATSHPVHLESPHSRYAQIYRAIAVDSMSRRELQNFCKDTKGRHATPCNAKSAILRKLVISIGSQMQTNGTASTALATSTRSPKKTSSASVSTEDLPNSELVDPALIEIVPSIVEVVGGDTVSALRALVPKSWMTVLVNAYVEHDRSLKKLRNALDAQNLGYDVDAYSPFRPSQSEIGTPATTSPRPYSPYRYRPTPQTPPR